MKPGTKKSRKKAKRAKNLREENRAGKRDERHGSSQQPSSNDTKLLVPSHEEEPPTSAFNSKNIEQDVDRSNNETLTVAFQSEDIGQAVDSSENKEECEEAETYSENKEKRKREILKILEERSIYKAEALSIMEARGKLTDEEVNSIVNKLYGIEFNNRHLFFEQKKAGRMVDDSKWKRTVTGAMVDGEPYVFKPAEPRTIRLSAHGDEAGNVKNGDKNTTNPVHRGDQLISRPSFAKYGHLPQYRWDLGDYPKGAFGNSENVEDFLVGGKEKLQEIRRELRGHSRPSSEENIEENRDGLPSSSRHDQPSPSRHVKTTYLWGVAIHHDDCECSRSSAEDGSN